MVIAKDFYHKKKSGQGMIEYFMIAALVAVVSVIMLEAAGDLIKDSIQNIGTKIQNANERSNSGW